MSSSIITLPVYTLQRSRRRRTVEIQVRPDGIRVLAPQQIAKHRIDRFVMQKADWIHQRQQALQQQLKQLEPYLETPLVSGAMLRFLGQRYPLQILPAATRTRIVQDENGIHIALSRRIRKAEPQALREQLERWYRDQASQLFTSRTAYWAEISGLTPARVSVRSYRRKWGCCNSRGQISFNWLLILAPLWVIDYVIVHELCHLQEMNHSSRFWTLVEKTLPDYRSAQQWLHQHGVSLRF